MKSYSRTGWWFLQCTIVLVASSLIVYADKRLGGFSDQGEYSNLLPQPLVIINQGGAGATIGSRRVKDAEPDGYTTLILHDAILTAKFSGTVDYGPEAFEPIAGTGEVGMVIAVLDDSEFKSLDDLMTRTYQRPNEVTFGANLGALTACS